MSIRNVSRLCLSSNRLKMCYLWSAAVGVACLMIVSRANCHIVEDQEYWFNLGQEDIARALKVEKNVGVAKNVILFIGDGLGLSTTTAARIYSVKENGYLAYETFPNVASLKTYSANKIVPDSSSTATALFAGVKANQLTVGVDYTVELDDCRASLKPEAQVPSIFDWAQKAGKKTGFVTTARVTHATPSALYAHTPNRNWECDANIPAESKACVDIARQLVQNEPGKNINVIMGGGRHCLQSDPASNDHDPINSYACYRKDGRNLIAEWQNEKEHRNRTYKYVSNNAELRTLADEDFVMGIFAKGHLKYNWARDQGDNGSPSLWNMTEAALRSLRNNDEGYVLIVEGGKIDMAHHRGHAKQALDETKEFSEAIGNTMKYIEDEAKDTLVIVTSDHSHPMVIAGYADRGTQITGIADASKIDGVPYTTLLYGTGGPNNHKYTIQAGQIVREDPSKVDTNDWEYSQQAAILQDEVTHDGSDVLVYARGPMAHLFHSVHEQTYVAHVIAYAAKFGPYTRNSVGCHEAALLIIFAIVTMKFLL